MEKYKERVIYINKRREDEEIYEHSSNARKICNIQSVVAQSLTLSSVSNVFLKECVERVILGKTLY